MLAEIRAFMQNSINKLNASSLFHWQWMHLDHMYFAMGLKIIENGCRTYFQISKTYLNKSQKQKQKTFMINIKYKIFLMLSIMRIVS